MKRFLAAAVPLLLLPLAQAASISTTMTVNNAPVTISGTGATVTGTAALTNIGGGSFNATGSFSNIDSSGTHIVAPFTIQLSTTDSITGNLTIPLAVLTGSSNQVSGSATVTGGTGAYANASGSFPSLTGTTSGSVAGGDLKLSFSGAGTVNTGGTGGGTGPTVTAVLDAASNTANVAEGCIFIVKGSNLAPAGLVQTSFPLPTSTSNGVSISFTPVGGGNATAAYMIYTCNTDTYGCVNDKTQLAAILPSSLAPGTYNVTVTNGNSTSAPFQATVVQRKFEVFTQDSTGTGLAVVQNYISASQVDLNRFTTGLVSGVTISPAKPGQPVIVWGTGMGPVPFADNTGAPSDTPYDFTQHGVTVQAIVGGVTIPVAFAGRTPTLAGEDEVVFNLPANIPTGCTVPLQISVNGALSVPLFMAIAPDANTNACVQPGYTAQQLQDLDNGKTITAGGFSLTQIQETVEGTAIKLDSVGGGFKQYSGFQLAAAAASQINVSTSTQGACQVITISGTNSISRLGSAGTVTGLDAGTITFNGPSGSGITNAPLTEDPKTRDYSLSLATEGLGFPNPSSLNATLTAGTYTLSGAGGSQVGSFNVSVNLGTPLTLNPALPTTVSRSSDLNLGWTGGNPSDLVEIVGYSGASTGTGTSVTTNATEFLCTTTAGKGSFTVPASVLMQLPVTAPATSGGSGFLQVSSGPPPSTFAPSLSGGGSIPSAFYALIGTGAVVTYQ